MATNEYDMLLEDQAQTGGNEYDALAQQDRADQKTQVRSVMFGAVDNNPDQYASAKRAGESLGIPAPVAHRNFAQVDKQAKLNEYDQILDSSPALAQHMGDQDFASIAHDDLHNTSAIEKTVRFFKRSGRTLASGFPNLSSSLDAVPEAAFDIASRYIGDPLARNEILPADPFAEPAEFFRGVRRNQAAFANQVQGDVSDAGFIEGSIYSGFQSLSQNAGPLAAGIITGNPELALYTMATSTGGQSYGQARDQGIPVDQAAPYALSQAAIEFATEKIPIERLFGDIHDKAGFLKTLAHNIATEVPGEEVATVLQDLNDWAVLNPDQPFSTYLKQRPSAAAQTLISTIIASGGQVTTSHVVNKAAEALVGPSQDAVAALENHKVLSDLVQMATDSKLRERSPESFQQFLQTATENGPVQDVYVDAKTFADVLNQAGVTPAQVAQESPSFAEQFNESVQTGGDIRIPVPEFSAHIAASDYAQALLPHLRTAPDAMSAAEAQQFMQEDLQRFKDEAGKVLETQQENEALQKSAQTIHDNILQQLDQANRFTTDVNKAYAAMVRDFYVVNSQKLGVTPEEMFKKYPLQIAAENIAAPNQLEQSTASDSRGHVAQTAEGYYVRGFSPTHAQPIVTTDIKQAKRFSSPEAFELWKQKQRAPDGGLWKGVRLLQRNELSNPSAVANSQAKEQNDTYGQSDRRTGQPESGPGAGQQEHATTIAGGRPRDGWREATRIRSKRTAQPLTVYRGADLELRPEHFEPGALGHATGRPSAGLGVFFTTDRSEAAQYGQVAEFNLDIRKPKLIKVEHVPTFESTEAAHDFARNLQNQGYDGIIIQASHIGGQNWVVAFQPEQVIKPESVFDQQNRGQISFASDITQAPSVIALLKNADLSTFLHESGHFFLEVYNHIASQADAPQQIRDDTDTLLKWFGVKDSAEWNAMSLEQKREHHEKFARGFEAYLFEGKAPSTELNGIFGRFRAWLLNVYQSLKNLNVKLTDEVRGVMDRMLATEQAIQSAEAARNYSPLFESAKQAGMTEQEWQSYQDLGASATEQAVEELQKRGLRDMRWLSNAKSRALKELQKDADEKRKAVRAEMAAQVNAEPVYAARQFIRYGTLNTEGQTNAQRRVAELSGVVGSKLSLPALKEMYGDGPAAPWRYLNTGKTGDVTAKDGEGLHPDMVAELFGFSSDDELVRKLLDTPPAKEVIDAKTDQTMLERYGDLTDPAELEKAAEAAIHNEARARFIATELRTLARANRVRENGVNVLARAAKQFAEETIARKRVRDVKPAQFVAAETRAGKAAEKAMKAGDTSTAIMEKRNQLINNYAAKAATTALDEVERGINYLRKFGTEASRKSIDPDYHDQIDKILERVDLRRAITGAQIDKRKSLAKWIEAQEALGFEPAISDEIRNEAFQKSYKEMTVEEFRGLVDSVKNIEHLGRLKTKLLTLQDQREFDAAVVDAAKAIQANAKTKIPPELESNTFSHRLKSGVKEFFAMHRKFASIIRQMDGFKEGGPLWELFIRPMNKAGDFEATRREKATVALSDIFKPILKTGKMHQKTFIPAIGTSLSREGRLSIALNWGNETNRARVMEGDKWSPAQVQSVLDTLTKDEWDFVQKVWDHLDSYWPEIAEKERRVTGIAPERVQPLAVQTKFGEYRGGYYPIKYDPNRSSRAESDSLAEQVKQTMQGLYLRATTRRGHTKARVESVQRPMRKDLGVVFEHVSQVVHDLAWHEYLIDANRLLRASAIDSAIRDHYGPEVLRLMKDTLNDVAAGDFPAQNAFEKSMNYIRSGATIAGLGWNLATSLMQPIGLTQSMVRIGPKWIAKGLGRWIGDAAHMQNSVKWIEQKSEFMRLRAKTMQREISEIRNQVSSGGKLSPVTDSYFWLIQKGQMIADVPTWLGAYERAMEEHNADEAKAISLADQAVLDAQGGGQVKDLAKIQRGGPLLKLWTNFYSFFNTTYNLTAESVHRTDFRNPKDIGRLAVDFLLLYTIPAALGTLVHAALKGDDRDLDKQLLRDQLNYLISTMVGLREIGGAVSGYDYSGPASVRLFQAIARLEKQAEQGELDKAAIEALNNVAGILFHYPAGQVQRTAEGIASLANGETENPGVLLSGPAKK